jgi:CYTH domain-containing protein
LVLAEVEAATRDVVAAIVPPAWVRDEVTALPGFTGAALARLDSNAAAALLADLIV